MRRSNDNEHTSLDDGRTRKDRIGRRTGDRTAPGRRHVAKPVPIWVVCVGDDLYVRSYRGRDGAWFRAAQTSGEGWIRAGGIEKDVSFVNETDPRLNDQVNAAYNTKYGRYPQYVAPMLTAEVRATTLKLAPRASDL
jgi:hypothetical protein